jgi:hypothetical protein
VDREGRWVLGALYEKIYPTTDDLIGVQKDGKVGFVDRTGRVVIDFQYQGIVHPNAVGLDLTPLYVFSDGLAVVLLPRTSKVETRVGVINKRGELLFDLPSRPSDFYSEGFWVVPRRADKKLGLVDKTGKWHTLPLPLNNDYRPSSVSEGILRVLTAENALQYKAGKFGYLKIKVKE